MTGSPVITYTPEDLTTTIGSSFPVNPFATVTVSDANPNATDTIFVSVTAGTGILSDGASYTGLKLDGTAGGATFYEIDGLTAAAATSELDALVFTPATGAPNSQQTTAFFVGALSSAGTATQTGPVTFVTATTPEGTIYGPQYGSGTTTDNGGTHIIDTYNYNNTINIHGGNDIVNAGQGNATITTGTGNVEIHLNGYGNSVTAGPDTNAGNGNDNVSGSQGTTTVTLGNGNDSINTGGYNNIITLGNGNDYVNGGLGNATINLGNGNDAVFVAGNPNKITVGSGDDFISASASGTTLSAGAGGVGVDTINLSGNTNHVTLNGSAADVTIKSAGGQQGSNSFTVNSGNDTLSFGGNTNTVSVSGTSTVTINDLGASLRLNVLSTTQTDFLSGFGTTDTSGVIDLKGIYPNTEAILSALQTDGTNTSLSLGSTPGSGVILFENTVPSQLHASNFSVA